MSDKEIKKNDQAGGITHKKDLNAGSGGFNQGSEQDPDFDQGTQVSDEEKLTGETPSPGKSKDGDNDLKSVTKR
jgi:hypothetical protein